MKIGNITILAALTAALVSCVGAKDGNPTELVLCGSNMVYIIDADAIEDGGSYTDGMIWSWDARSAADIVGLPESRMQHVDDCKPVDVGKNLLITSSIGWCVLIEVETGDILFWSTSCPMAHSAEMLPGGRIAIACSVGESAAHNTVQLYDVTRPNEVLDSHELHSAHGVIWNDETQRLYALGYDRIQVYSPVDWDSESPTLSLEEEIEIPQENGHDLNLVDCNTLSVAGHGAYLYSIDSGNWEEMPFFSGSTGVKSLNYNVDTGELWYTDATYPEGDFTWSTQTLRHASSPDGAQDRTIRVPDINCYKVRVLNW